MQSLLLRVAASAAAICFCQTPAISSEAAGGLRVATFRCDVTPPLGQPLAGGEALRTVEQPLLAKGIVLESGGQRYVLCALDWCALCNASHDALQRKIASAAGADAAHDSDHGFCGGRFGHKGSLPSTLILGVPWLAADWGRNHAASI